MATDKTAFDDYLKESLHRDVLFRTLVWASVAGLTTYLASRSTTFTSIENLKRVISTLAPVVNAVGLTAIILSGIALLLKDLEHVSPGAWGQSTKVGKIGGVVRRLAGDLGLWVVGALVTILAAIGFVAIDASKAGQIKENFAAIFLMSFIFVLFAIIVATLNVFVRRSQPPVTANKAFSSLLTTAPKVVIFYLLLLSFTYFTSTHS